jgi:hypothetical protein
MAEGRSVFPLKSAYPFGESHGLSKEIAEIRNMIIEWNLPYTSSLRRGYVIDLFEAKVSCWSSSKLIGSLDRHRGEQSRMRFWKKVNRRYQMFLAGAGEEAAIESQMESESDCSSVPYL